jgi:cell division protease FtsH
MAVAVDEEVQKLLREADDMAFKLLSENRAALDKLADELVKKEELSRAEIEAILGPGQGKGTEVPTNSTDSANPDRSTSPLGSPNP